MRVLRKLGTMTVHQGNSAWCHLASKYSLLFLCLLFTHVSTLAYEGPQVSPMRMPNVAGSLLPSRALREHIVLVLGHKAVKSTSVILVSSSSRRCG